MEKKKKTLSLETSPTEKKKLWAFCTTRAKSPKRISYWTRARVMDAFEVQLGSHVRMRAFFQEVL